MRNRTMQQVDAVGYRSRAGIVPNANGNPHVKPSPTSPSQPMLDLNVSFSHENIMRAARILKRRKTSPGVDGVDPREYFKKVVEHGHLRDRLRDLVFDRSYRPSPYRRASIPKGNGKFRMISIPTAQDRLIQRVLADAMYPRLSAALHLNSFAYQRRRSTFHAASLANRMGETYPIAVKIDVEAYYDSINRELLIWILDQLGIETGHQRLVRRLIYTSALDHGRKEWSRTGIAQGGPLSPVLANLYLTPLDWWMDKMNIPFVRYADDILAFASSPSGGWFTLDGVGSFCRKTLKLSVNREKSQVREFEGVPLLGFQLGSRGVEFSMDALRGRLESLTASVAEAPTPDLVLKNFEKILNKVRGRAAYYRGTVNYPSEGVPLLLAHVEQLTSTFMGDLPLDCLLTKIEGFTVKEHIDRLRFQVERHILKTGSSTPSIVQDPNVYGTLTHTYRRDTSTNLSTEAVGNPPTNALTEHGDD